MEGTALPLLLTTIRRSPNCNRSSLKFDSSGYLMIWMTASSFKSMAHPPGTGKQPANRCPSYSIDSWERRFSAEISLPALERVTHGPTGVAPRFWPLSHTRRNHGASRLSRQRHEIPMKSLHFQHQFAPDRNLQCRSHQTGGNEPQSQGRFTIGLNLGISLDLQI